MPDPQPTTTAPATTTPAEPAQTTAPTPTVPQKPEGATPPDEPLGEPGKRALEEERAARKRLEQEVAPLRSQMDALRQAFGGDSTTGKPEDVVATLQQQVAEMRHDTLVERVARSHGITNDADVAVLRAIKDEALMGQLAERLKAPPGPTVPAPDPGQGARAATPQAERDAEYQKYFPDSR